MLMSSFLQINIYISESDWNIWTVSYVRFKHDIMTRSLTSTTGHRRKLHVYLWGPSLDKMQIWEKNFRKKNSTELIFVIPEYIVR
jgi:hypothetical protein